MVTSKIATLRGHSNETKVESETCFHSSSQYMLLLYKLYSICCIAWMQIPKNLERMIFQCQHATLHYASVCAWVCANLHVCCMLYANVQYYAIPNNYITLISGAQWDDIFMPSSIISIIASHYWSSNNYNPSDKSLKQTEVNGYTLHACVRWDERCNQMI